MKNLIFTLDYEIHGNGDGCPYKLMVEPTYRIMKLFDSYGAKLTIMADVAEIIKFKEYKELHGTDKYHFDKIVEQLQFAVSNGHDVQLHIHSGYFNSKFTNANIEQNWEEYDLANLPYDLIYNRVKICKDFLHKELRKVKPNYNCIAFRAANWSMNPTKNILRSLVDNDLLIDSSVFKWGKRTGRVNFDYANSPDKLLPWLIDENNVCEKSDNGELLEIPIYTENRYFFAFITYIRLFRMIRAKFHKHKRHIPQESAKINMSDQTTIKDSNLKPSQNRIYNFYKKLRNKHAWKLDFNQASGKQLIKAVKRIDVEYSNSIDIPVVLIGHSKSFIKYNQKTLRPFLHYISKNRDKYDFSVFSDISIKNF